MLVSSHLLSEMSQMADNIIVIGRGKLIANTSMSQLLAGSSHSGAFVRANDLAKLDKALKTSGLSTEKSAAGLEVFGAKTDEIGKLAFAAGVTILELAPHTASLEEAFLELTSDAQEYQTGKQKGNAKDHEASRHVDQEACEHDGGQAEKFHEECQHVRTPCDED